jgi:hypothetical protein
MNGRCGRRRSWPNARYCPGIFLEGLRKITNNLAQNSRYLGQDSNWTSDKYESRALTLEPTSAVSALEVRSRPDGAPASYGNSDTLQSKDAHFNKKLFVDFMELVQ